MPVYLTFSKIICISSSEYPLTSASLVVIAYSSCESAITFYPEASNFC